ncbi:ABC transporter ATP-binding protein (plasmid) [Salipiger sp. H15]|uniref:ABC transporter ATP-binding protein n=1 Tax=Alloyangia sp. H15 TaxID=3029062 RepID=A0AAU8AU09_9RHOB
MQAAPKPLNDLPRAVPARPEPVLELLSAEKSFATGRQGARQVLAPVDLTIARGELVTLIGPSGCGKSTLLNLMAGLLEPSDGRVLWWRGPKARTGAEGKRMSVVFQDATLMPWARVQKNVRLPLDLAGVPKAEGDARASAALEQVGLAGTERLYPRQMSGGMRMRASIARALVSAPDLLLMDEPFGALDEFTRNKLDDDLLRLRQERDLTLVFVTHSIYEAVFLSSRVIVMAAHPGRIHAELSIDTSYPRDEAFRVSQQFTDYCAELSRLLGEASTECPR